MPAANLCAARVCAACACAEPNGLLPAHVSGPARRGERDAAGTHSASLLWKLQRATGLLRLEVLDVSHAWPRSRWRRSRVEVWVHMTPRARDAHTP